MKVFSIKKERILIVLYIIIIIFGVSKSIQNKAVPTFSMPVSKKVIVLDAGHGGWDPGKVGDENILEKDINLAIATKLQNYLEQGGSTVIITRDNDSALGDSKNADLKQRVGIANNGSADLLVSIHQNSYEEESVNGAQVFYLNSSDNSQQLALCIQDSLNTFLDNTNDKLAKSNTNYYLLKKTSMPSVIVECGFFSNKNEMSNLQNEDYQEKVAWAIYKGIVGYFNEDK